MTNKEVRKVIFGQMLRQNKKTSFWRPVYKLVFLVEEYGYSVLEARTKVERTRKTQARLIHNLYLLRSSHLRALGKDEYLIFERLDNKAMDWEGRSKNGQNRTE